VFAFGPSVDEIPHGDDLLACMTNCYGDFRRRLGQAHKIWSCRCDACSRIDVLDLKFILHAGAFVIHSIAGGRELVGPHVVMAHRLLKNHASELLGHGAYALVTDAAATELAVPTEHSLALTETYEHYEAVRAHVFALR
jgi:Protein of unknown function (DUF2652)